MTDRPKTTETIDTAEEIVLPDEVPAKATAGSGEPPRTSTADIFVRDLEEDVYDDTDDSAPRWYVIHTYSGHEGKVKQNIEKIVENSSEASGIKNKILKVVVPTEDYTVLVDGKRRPKSRKSYPGYVLVKMQMEDKAWFLVRNTQGVTGFVGHAAHTAGKMDPIPLTKEEVRRMGIDKVYIELDINEGDSIKVINGPFEGLEGIVEEVNPEKETLKARISMFGRDTSVELIYDQVEQL
jgi:transcriptional antiterminator NusG